jgi:hypothetical protein
MEPLGYRGHAAAAQPGRGIAGEVGVVNSRRWTWVAGAVAVAAVGGYGLHAALTGPTGHATQQDRQRAVLAEWPGASNTGVPPGTSLSAYDGPCQITADDTVIDSRTVNCGADGLSVRAANLVIRNSKVNGIIRLDTDRAGAQGWSVSVRHSEVDAGVVQLAAICCGNLTVDRVNVHGGVTAVQCEASGPTSGGDPAPECTVRDSYLHGQQIPRNAQWHLGGFLTEGGDTVVTLEHNYVICDAPAYPPDGGCTGDINLLGNFGVLHGVTIANNKLGASPSLSYCTFAGSGAAGFGPRTRDIVYRGNVFERGKTGKCGQYGPVTDLDKTRPGTVWTNNKYDDGALIPAP